MWKIYKFSSSQKFSESKKGEWRGKEFTFAQKTLSSKGNIFPLLMKDIFYRRTFLVLVSMLRYRSWKLRRNLKTLVWNLDQFLKLIVQRMRTFFILFFTSNLAVFSSEATAKLFNYEFSKWNLDEVKLHCL